MKAGNARGEAGFWQFGVELSARVFYDAGNRVADIVHVGVVQARDVGTARAHHVDAVLVAQGLDLVFGQAGVGEHAALAGYVAKALGPARRCRSVNLILQPAKPIGSGGQ